MYIKVDMTNVNSMRPLISFQCSQIAAAIGYNPYKTSSEIIESLWRKQAKDSFEKAFAQAKTPGVRQNIRMAMSEVPKASELCQAGVDTGNKVKSVEDVQQKTAQLLGGADESKIAAQVRLDQLKDSARKGDLTSKLAIPDAEKKVQIVSSAVEIVKKEIQRSMNTTFGTARESDAISLFEKENDLSISRDRSIRRKIYNDSFVIVGAVDGLLDTDCVIEVKNRTRRLFNMIPGYEKVQIQAYMQLFERSRAILIECLTSKDGSVISKIEQVKDDEYWSVVLYKLEKVCELLRNLMNECSFADTYAGMNAEDREAFIQQSIS